MSFSDAKLRADFKCQCKDFVPIVVSCKVTDVLKGPVGPLSIQIGNLNCKICSKIIFEQENNPNKANYTPTPLKKVFSASKDEAGPSNRVENKNRAAYKPRHVPYASSDSPSSSEMKCGRKLVEELCDIATNTVKSWADDVYANLRLPKHLKIFYFYRKLLESRETIRMNMDRQLEAQFLIRLEKQKKTDDDFSEDSNLDDTATTSNDSEVGRENTLQALNDGIEESVDNLLDLMNYLEDDTLPVQVQEMDLVEGDAIVQIQVEEKKVEVVEENASAPIQIEEKKAKDAIISRVTRKQSKLMILKKT